MELDLGGELAGHFGKAEVLDDQGVDPGGGGIRQALAQKDTYNLSDGTFSEVGSFNDELSGQNPRLSPQDAVILFLTMSAILDMFCYFGRGCAGDAPN